MSLAVERFDARSWPEGELDLLFEGAFPAYITADQVAKAYIGRTREWFAAPQAGCQRVLAPVRPTLKPAYPHQ